MATYTFVETQRFRSFWIWAILLGVTGLVLCVLFWANPPKPSNGWEKVLPLFILFLVNGLFLLLKLSVKINGNSLVFDFFPFIRERKYQFEEIKSMELIEYNSLLKYGGWGIRYNFDSWAYNTGGKYGIMVQLKDKKFLLGTYNPAEARKAIEQFHKFKLQSHGG